MEGGRNQRLWVAPTLEHVAGQVGHYERYGRRHQVQGPVPALI